LVVYCTCEENILNGSEHIQKSYINSSVISAAESLLIAAKYGNTGTSSMLLRQSTFVEVLHDSKCEARKTVYSVPQYWSSGLEVM
jgi:hypothetical protein